VLDFVKNVVVLGKSKVGFALWANAGQKFVAVFGVGCWLDNADFLAALFVIEGDLQKLHGFAAAHCSVAEI
jgi:hypothetical protein